MSHSSYPVALNLYARPCLVVGGGPLALEKVEGLLGASADVRCVDPNPIPALRLLAERGDIRLDVRPYVSSDVEGKTVVFGASDDRDLNARVARDGRRAGALVNAVDDIPHCDFFAVSLVRRGDVQVAISTNGRSPALARWLRESLQAALSPDLGGLLDVLAQVRSETRAAGRVYPYERWKEAISGEVLSAVRRGDLRDARARVRVALDAAIDQRVPAEVA